MAHRITRTLTAVLALNLLSLTLAQAQDQGTTVDLPASASTTQRWDYASLLATSGRKILVITTAQPTHRIACRVKSSTVDHLACKDPFGVTHTYKS